MDCMCLIHMHIGNYKFWLQSTKTAYNILFGFKLNPGLLQLVQVGKTKASCDVCLSSLY